ncbi:MAG: hypothetical protein IKP65_02450 [Alphaproteobacteria bacterium]|nr:hypothetical protein [Alphaproteobacteria bacterium]
MKELINIAINCYFALSLFRAGYIYKEYEKEYKGKETMLFINAMFFGFFGYFMFLYYKLRLNCKDCKNFNNNRCNKTGKFTNKYNKSCKEFK